MPSLKATVLCATLLANIPALHAQTVPQPPHYLTSGSNSLIQHDVVYVAGFEEVKANVSGDLALSPADLTFSNKNASTSIPRERIFNAFISDQRTEPWQNRHNWR